MHGESLGNSHLSHGKEGFAEAERKSLSDLCSERNGIWQRDVGMGNEGRGYAKTRKNREDDDQMDVRCKTE